MPWFDMDKLESFAWDEMLKVIRRDRARKSAWFETLVEVTKGRGGDADE